MAEGELLQIEKARKLDITEDVYFDIIRKKTATLIAACCAVGVQSTDADNKYVEMAHAFGEKVGIAFQIKDDLFDYGTTDAIGKPVGIDIQERKLTLPLIHVLGKVDRDTGKKLIRTVRKFNTDKTKVEELMAQVVELGGIKYATEKMYEFRDKALDILNQTEKQSTSTPCRIRSRFGAAPLSPVPAGRRLFRNSRFPQRPAHHRQCRRCRSLSVAAFGLRPRA